ncbi:MAG: helix-hairpin-helix domain-containing protein [Limisphaerales bacterium]
MKLLSLENSSVQPPSFQLARLSRPHGYRLDGDTVHLNARFALLDPAAHERSWSLQLWACPSAPLSAGDLAGHIVAEVSLPPMGEIADEIEHFDVSAPAWPPAGIGEHVMVLVLASSRPGQYHDIHDLAVYPHRQPFTQPRMSGNVGYRLDGSRVQISVGPIENPRAASNRSGTLSLELWALSAPFAGGRFEGQHLAGVEIGSVNGESELVLQPIDLAFTPPPAGRWQIVLMLREWTAAGFVTRDFTNFTNAFVVAAPVMEKAPAPVVEKPVLSAVEEPAAPVVARTQEPVVVTALPPEAVKTPAPEVAKAVAPIAQGKSPANAPAKGVSVNRARVEELAAVQGLNKKLAEGIVKKRPFASLDDLSKVKGLGARVLAKVRSSLKL